jgi:hypothetical protein
VARDAQTAKVGTDFGVVDVVPLEHNPASALTPFQMVSFRGSLVLDGSGAGDTADCRITMPLAGNNVYQMHSFAMWSDVTSYDEGYLEVYYAPKSGEFGQTTQINFPLTFSRSMDLAQAGSGMATYNIASILYDGSTTAYHPQILNADSQSPFKFIFGGAEVGGTDPVIWIGGGSSTAVPSGNLYLVCNFLGFTIDQWSNAALYTGLIQR